MDMLTTAQALELLRERGVSVAYPTVALWVREGKFTGAELEDTPRGPVWRIPRDSVLRFEPPKMGRPPKPKASGTDGKVVVKTGQAIGKSPKQPSKKGGKK